MRKKNLETKDRYDPTENIPLVKPIYDLRVALINDLDKGYDANES